MAGMSEPLPVGLDVEPPRVAGGPVYLPAFDGKWYPLRNAATGALVRWGPLVRWQDVDLGESEPEPAVVVEVPRA